VSDLKLNGIHPDNVLKLGGPEHAALLGVRKIKTGEKDLTLQHEGYTLSNILMYGRFATQEYLQAVLEDRVSRLKAKPQKLQSDDPRKPGYRLRLFDPKAESTSVPTKVEVKAALEVIARAKEHFDL